MVEAEFGHSFGILLNTTGQPGERKTKPVCFTRSRQGGPDGVQPAARWVLPHAPLRAAPGLCAPNPWGFHVLAPTTGQCEWRPCPWELHTGYQYSLLQTGAGEFPWHLGYSEAFESVHQ